MMEYRIHRVAEHEIDEVSRELASRLSAVDAECFAETGSSVEAAIRRMLTRSEDRFTARTTSGDLVAVLGVWKAMMLSCEVWPWVLMTERGRSELPRFRFHKIARAFVRSLASAGSRVRVDMNQGGDLRRRWLKRIGFSDSGVFEG